MPADPLGNLFSKVRAGLDADPPADDAPPPVEVEVEVVEVAEVVEVVEVVEVAAVGADPTPGTFVPTTTAVDLLDLAPVDPEPQWPAFSVAESATLDDAALRRRRDASVSSALGILAPVVKRHLQDEQNELLDALRRQKWRGPVAAALPDPDRRVTGWAEAVRAPVDDVYAAGRVLGGGRTRPAPADLVERLAEVLVAPLGERIATSLAGALHDEADRSDSERQRALTAVVGARYREWRGQDLEPTLGDLLTWAFARGVFDATPEGATLRWVPAEVQQCPDADDNALEPTGKGSAFPTGQSCPPAHPGCRCLVVPIDG